LLRLAGGTGGIWLDITKLLTLRVFLRVFFDAQEICEEKECSFEKAGSGR
jgi:hypothetical protein